MLRAGRSHDKDHSARQDGRDRISPQRHGPSQPARPSTRNGERGDNDYYSTHLFCITYELPFCTMSHTHTFREKQHPEKLTQKARI